MEENFFIDDWNIENFSCWNVEVHGPEIRVCNALILYPKGKSGQDDHMSVKILFPIGVIPLGDFSLLRSDGTIICKQLVTQGEKCLFPFKLSFKDVVSDIRNNEGLEDRLTVRHRYKAISGYGVKCTSIDVITNSIHINSEILGRNEDISFIQIVSGDGSHDQMELMILHEGDKHVLQLSLGSGTLLRAPFSVQSTVGFLNNGETIELYKEKEHVFKNNNPFVIIDSIEMKEVIEKRTPVFLRLKTMNGRMEYKNSHCTFLEQAKIVLDDRVGFSKQKPSRLDNSIEHLSKELMFLFQNQNFSDFQIKCKDVFFPVHKAILSARSPVFKSMLSAADMQEAASGSMDVEDVSPSTLVSFLYTGTVGEELQGESVYNLYYVADKYQVPSLKKECTDYLIDNISISNVCDLLSLADKHRNDQLISATNEFILNYFNEVTRSEEWGTFIRSEPLLAATTLTRFAATDCVLKNYSK